MNEARTDWSQPGDSVEASRSSSRNYINIQAGAILYHEDETQHDLPPPSALSTNQRSDLGEHYNATSQPLLDCDNETRKSQRQSSLTIATNSLQPIRHDDTPTQSLLHREKPPKISVGWPSSAKAIKTPIYIKAINTILNVLLFACSVTFLVFALVVNIHDQYSTAEYPHLTTTLLNATKYGPTVFPILFASVIGRAAHAIILWRLEKGEHIGVLDTLASSTSLTSTVISQLQLRSVSILGVSLLVVWSLSPIGGQASVRIMTIGSKDTQIHETSWYMVNNGYLSAYSSAGMYIQGTASAGVAFVAAIMGSPATKSSPLDLWGNVKIPRIEGYEEIAQMDGEGWYDTDGGDVDTYSSLIGTPITGINDSKFIDYVTKVQSPYLSLQCSINNTDQGSGPRDNGLPGLSSNASSTGSMIFWDIPNVMEKANSSQKQRDRMSPESVPPLKIRYVPIYDRSNFTLTCNVTQSYVEAEIRCPTPSTCAASRIRRSKLNHLPPAWTLLDLSWRTPSLLFKGMLANFNGKVSYPQLLDRYLSDTYLINSNYANVSQTTEDKSTIRLGQMLNAYFACLNGFFAVSAGINNDTAYFWDNNQTFAMKQKVLRGDGTIDDPYDSTQSNATFKTKTWSSDVTKTERRDVIVAHRGWVVALCFASITLIVASLVAPIVHYCLTVGVDIAMNFSSLATRDNPYMDLPWTGTYLDASDRARLLRNHKVRFGEADGAAGVGTLVIGSVGGAEGLEITRVRKGRLYE